MTRPRTGIRERADYGLSVALSYQLRRLYRNLNISGLVDRNTDQRFHRHGEGNGH
jgi:hypothetical protein